MSRNVVLFFFLGCVALACVAYVAMRRAQFVSVFVESIKQNDIQDTADVALALRRSHNGRLLYLLFTQVPMDTSAGNMQVAYDQGTFTVRIPLSESGSTGHVNICRINGRHQVSINGTQTIIDDLDGKAYIVQSDGQRKCLSLPKGEVDTLAPGPDSLQRPHRWLDYYLAAARD